MQSPARLAGQRGAPRRRRFAWLPDSLDCRSRVFPWLGIGQAMECRLVDTSAPKRMKHFIQVLKRLCEF